MSKKEACGLCSVMIQQHYWNNINPSKSENIKSKTNILYKKKITAI